MQRTVKPETKNFDFYSKVKKAKSKDFKRTESLRKSKSKLNTNVDLNNNSVNQRIESTKPAESQINQVVAPPPPPPMPIKPTVNQTNKSTINHSAPAPPPPPPLPVMNKQPIKPTVNQQSIKPTVNQQPIKPFINQQATVNKVGLQSNNQPIKTPSPVQSITSSRTSSPQPSSNTSSRVSSPIPNSKLINTNTQSPIKPASQLNNGFNKPVTNSLPAQSKLDQTRLNKFNKTNEQNSWLTDRCVDFNVKLNSPKPAELVRNIPIKIESSTASKSPSPTPDDQNKKEDVKEEIVELEVEESSEEESEEEESSSEESEEETEESKEESEEGTRSFCLSDQLNT